MKVVVFKRGELKADQKELDLLLAEAGCVEVGEVQAQLASEDAQDGPVSEESGETDQANEANESDEDEMEGDVTLIVVLTPECVGDPELDDVVTEAIRNGMRAVGVWPKDAKEHALPPSLDKLGSSTVPWDPKKLASTLSDTQTVWENPAGLPRPAQKIKRNKC